MVQRIRPYVTGVALVGASAIAVAPIAAPPPDVYSAVQPAAQRVVTTTDVQLTSLGEDLVRSLDALVRSPEATFQAIGGAIERLQQDFDDAASAREVIGALGRAVNDICGAPINALRRPLTVNVPGDPSEWDVVDATLQTIDSLIGIPLGVPTIPADLVFWYGEGFSPIQAATLVGGSYLLSPLTLALPFVVAAANALPSPLGGDVNSVDPAEQGVIYGNFVRVYQSAVGLVGELIGEPNQMLAKHGVSATAVQATFLPPPIDGIPGATKPSEQGLLNQVMPDPLTTKTLPAGSSKVPDVNSQKNIEDQGNLILSRGTDPTNGKAVTNVANSKEVRNGRTVLREVRESVKQTVKDLRNVVKDTVNAVTGLGKKKTDEPEQKDQKQTLGGSEGN